VSVLLRVVTTLHRALYRATRGRLGRRIAGMPVLLLTTTGRRTGAARTVPLSYFEDGGAYVIVGSKGGAPRHPAWYLNLEAQPEVEVQLGNRRERRRARRASPAESERLWPTILERAPGYGRYRAKTSREIPLVFLDSV
jgi:deazaflavin-dependent oxidoreductase (nitroreductase family)